MIKEKKTMKKVVVTGAKGGTGLSVVRVLREAGYYVLGVDLKPCGFWEQDYRQLNLEDGAGVYDVLAGADAVVHFGSLPNDTWTPWETTYRNLSLGGYHILQAAANLRIPRVVLASSPMIYGEYRRASYLPIDEEAPACPDGIYGAVKQNLETLAQHYVRWNGMAIAALRPQRIVYEGSYEWRFRKFTVNDAAAANSIWSYVDARDVATACLAWLQSDRTGFEVFNVAADDVCVTTPTRNLLANYYPQVSDLRGELANRVGLVSCEKLKQMLGWRPVYTWQKMAAESEKLGFSNSPPT
jgi:nucleoside-diphosphate-sugar epimerase